MTTNSKTTNKTALHDNRTATATAPEIHVKAVSKAHRDVPFIGCLTDLWRDSVVSTHHFLQCNDIRELTPYVVQALQSIPFLYVAYSDGRPVAFMGIDGNKIEMLFVSPRHLRHGIGKCLVKLAIQEHNAVLVDANEQNTQAVLFYRHMGFEVVGRTETDGQGNPFPILEMRLGDRCNPAGKE